jgi:hypothetical protein
MVELFVQDGGPMGRSETFRADVQPLVRQAVMRGVSVSEVARILRETHGRAYRRTDLLADIRRYREPAHEIVVAGISNAAPRVARESRMHWTLAHAGVAVFAITLLVPTIVYDLTRARGTVLVAAASEERVVARDLSLPNQVAELPRRLPPPQPTPEPTPLPTPAPPLLVRGGPGVVVTASWYGPGFFENRLPCWQWLQAQDLPIQFLPDTWGVAHKSLPCGTMLVLSHGANTITVPVVDRGPYVAGRELDLSPRIKSALGCTDLCTVVMQLP